MVTQAAAEEAAAKAREQFAALDGVNGIGVARFEDGYAVRVNVRKGTKGHRELPDDVDGVPVVVRQIGPLALY